MQRLTVVDAFTSVPFAGNPAAVCLLDAPADDGWMQLVAREMSLAETAFLVPRAEGWQLRWMTPLVEVDLCGHATLAAAHVLYSDGHLPRNRTARFETRSGTLTADLRDGLIWLDFPATPAPPCPDPGTLMAALGAEAKYIGRSRFDYLVELANEAAVRALTPDLSALSRLDGRGVIVTGKADSTEFVKSAFDYVSRFFAPAAGVPEDPVTGSAHCALAPYWSGKLGRNELTGYQASARGGLVKTVLKGDRVLLGGNAVTVSRVELL